MSLLNSFIDSIVCVGFSSECGVTLDPESKNNESFFTAYLQSSVLGIITCDRAMYPTARGSDFIDSSYPPINRLSVHSSLEQSGSSNCSTPLSLLATGIKTQKQHIIPATYKDLPYFCFPDGVRATYQLEKEKIHHFVLTQDGKRTYALVLTFQQQFTLQTNKPDDEGVYQICDFKSGRSTTSKIPVAIDKQKTVSTPAPPPTTTSPVTMRTKKMPSSYPVAHVSPVKKQPTPNPQDTAKQTSRPHYAVHTVTSYQKDLSKKAAPPPSRMGRARSQDNVSVTGFTTSTTGSSSAMKKRSGSIISKPAPINIGPISSTSASSSSSSAAASSSSSSSSSSTSTSLSTMKPFYLPHCVVLMSSEPYWTAMQETVSIIHDEIIRSHIEPSSSTYKKLIQRYAFLACNTPIPPIPWERFSLSFNVTNDRFVITFDPPVNANRSILDLDLSTLLLTINIGKLLDVLAAIFTEQPIMFFSENYSKLVITLECLLYLIYPLKWTNVYLPLVPDGLRDIYFNGSPGVYIEGAHTRHQSIIQDLNICFICNLDDDKNVFVPKHVEFHRIPPTKLHRFFDPITQLLEKVKVDRALKNVPTVARPRMERQRELERQHRFETNQEIIKIFLTLMIDLCGDVYEPIYWKVNPQHNSPTNTSTNKISIDKRNSNQVQSITTTRSIFNKEKYLLPKMEGIELEFYRAFVETIAFQNLLKEEMISTLSSGFKQLCQMHLSSKQNQLYQFTNIQEIIDDNQNGSRSRLSDPLSSQMILPLALPSWSSDLSTHYLDNCIDLFTEELENVQQERSPAIMSVYAYLRGCARLARGDYLAGLHDLYLIENPNLFPQKYIETVIVPRLADGYLLNLFLTEPFYTNCPEWKKVQTRQNSQNMTFIDLDTSEKVPDAAVVHPSPDIVDSTEWDVIEQSLTYEQFSDRIHHLSIVSDKETTDILFKVLLYWTDNSLSKTLKKLSNNSDKAHEPLKSANRIGSTSTVFTFSDTLTMAKDHRRGSPAATPTTAKTLTQPSVTLPATLFESFVDIWQQRNTEKIRMNRQLPEDRQNQESILTVSSPGIVSKKDGPGQIILTQKRLYFLPEVRSSPRLLSELSNITSIDKYQHQTMFSSKPGVKIHSSSNPSLPRDNLSKLKSKTSSLEAESKSSSISFYFKNHYEQNLWYTTINELWSGSKLAYEQVDIAILNKASRHVALIDTLTYIDYTEESISSTDKQSTNSSQKSKQHHNEASLEMALKDLSIFIHMRHKLKPLSVETRNVLIRRLSPSINEIESHTVRCLIFTEHLDTGHSSLWCAYGQKLKVFDAATWKCDPNSLCFPSLITSMCLDARYKLWIRCSGGQLFVVDTVTHMCETELTTNDGENGCQTIAFDSIHNHILTANRNGTITIWNASNWKPLYNINVLDLYKKTNHIPDRTYISHAVVTSHNSTQPSNVGKTPNRKPTLSSHAKESLIPTDIPDLPSSTGPATVIPLPTDKLERIQIYENLLFACYRDDYIIVLRKSDSNTYIYEHLISSKYKTDASVPIDSFLIYNQQLWVSSGCIISIFNANNTNDENPYNLLMKIPVDDDNLVTMLGFSGYIWAGSFNGNVYVFRMDNYELHKTYSGHRDSVWCLCSIFDTYVASGSAQNYPSIAIWDNVQTSVIRTRTSSSLSITNSRDGSNSLRNSRINEKNDIKPTDLL